MACNLIVISFPLLLSHFSLSLFSLLLSNTSLETNSHILLLFSLFLFFSLHSVLSCSILVFSFFCFLVNLRSVLSFTPTLDWFPQEHKYTSNEGNSMNGEEERKEEEKRERKKRRRERKRKKREEKRKEGVFYFECDTKHRSNYFADVILSFIWIS